MSDSPEIPPPPPPYATPPTAPGELIARTRVSRWPGVIGTICIILGVAAFLQGGFGILMVVFMRGFVDMSGSPELEAQAAVGDEFFLQNMISNAGSMALALLVFVGGIMLLQRRRIAAKLLCSWAIAKILWSFVGGYIGYQVASKTVEMTQAAQSQPTNPAGPDIAAMVQSFSVLMVGAGVCWLWILPVFILIWFARQPIKAEIANWR